MRRVEAAGEGFFQGLGGYYLQGRVGGHGAGDEGERRSRLCNGKFSLYFIFNNFRIKKQFFPPLLSLPCSLLLLFLFNLPAGKSRGESFRQVGFSEIGGGEGKREVQFAGDAGLIRQRDAERDGRRKTRDAEREGEREREKQELY